MTELDAKTLARRVVEVCLSHPTDDGRVRAKLCRSLVNAGYDVHLIALGTEKGPGPDGVVVHPHGVGASRVRKFLERRRIAAHAAGLSPDIIHVHEPFLFGSVVAARGSSRIVWDVHEDYEILLAGHVAIPKPLRRIVWRLWDWQERRLLRHVDLILAATPGVAERYLSLHPNVVTVPNYPEIPVFDGPHPWTEPHLLFSGAICENRGVVEILEALGVLRREGLRIPFTIAGPMGSDAYEARLLEAIRKNGLGDDVKYVGWLPREEVVALACRATVGMVAHLPESQGDIAWPVKMFEYMACGLPLVYTNLGAMTEIAGDRAIGIAVEPRDIPALADAIRQLVSDPARSASCGATGRELVRTRFAWSVVEPLLVESFERLGVSTTGR